MNFSERHFRTIFLYDSIVFNEEGPERMAHLVKVKYSLLKIKGLGVNYDDEVLTVYKKLASSVE